MDEEVLNKVAVMSEADFDNFSSNHDAVLLNVSSTDDINPGVEVSTGDRRHFPVYRQIIITSCYLFGIGGNLAALGIISRNETNRYKKQTLMLKFLAWNDLTALVGSFILMYVSLYMPSADARWLCATRVVCRAFGLGSGCVAFVMALERWLALSHPFTYQKYITQTVIRLAILGLWTFNVLLVCAPFVGFGLWFNEKLPQRPCVRYRFGTTPMDRAYAYFVFVFGMSMCICIVCCNLSVRRILSRFDKRMITRRYSRASCRSSSSTAEPSYNLATPEELSFARLMAVLSIFFVICWVPQLMTIIAAQHSLIERKSQLYQAANILMALNFTLDPYLYVLFRRQQLCGFRSLNKQARINGSSHRKGFSTQNPVMNNSTRSIINANETSSDARTRPATSSRNSSSEKEYVPLKMLL